MWERNVVGVQLQIMRQRPLPSGSECQDRVTLHSRRVSPPHLSRCQRVGRNFQQRTSTVDRGRASCKGARGRGRRSMCGEDRLPVGLAGGMRGGRALGGGQDRLGPLVRVLGLPRPHAITPQRGHSAWSAQLQTLALSDRDLANNLFSTPPPSPRTGEPRAKGIEATTTLCAPGTRSRACNGQAALCSSSGSGR